MINIKMVLKVAKKVGGDDCKGGGAMAGEQLL